MKEQNISFGQPSNCRFDVGQFLAAGALFGRQDGFVEVGIAPRPSKVPSPDMACLYSPDFFLATSSPWMVFEQTHVVHREELLQALNERARRRWIVRDDEPPSRELFLAVFEKIMDGIESGAWQKVVPYSIARWRARTGPQEIAEALGRLLELPTTLMPYGLWTADAGMLGATPELLLRKEGACISSVAMAGTRPKLSDKPPLTQDEKQLMEHRAVVEDIETQLGKLGRVTVDSARVVDLIHLEHLSASISVVLTEKKSFQYLVRHLHPTPALGSSPRGAASSLFEELNRSLPRERFGAPFGWREPNDDGICVVAIRNVQWRGDDMSLAAGCGIVPASRFEDEWSELLAKQRAIRKNLGID